uniref:DNA-directed RNA polymerase n=1 Tax=Echinostoma caproni TaxID=27848 RepID=A0A183AFH6_9TREM
LLVPSEEMPWTVTSGIVPDLIFNPHGFPTRMTMGMMIEFLAGKSAALTGKRVDATSFQWTEDNPPFTDYCEELAKHGFNYWGTEMMMSGCNGRQLEAHIYIGVVYYQRLRHMVADKYQVRAQGRFDPILRQPIKGRKLGGGIRLGEMERDCLLSQGLTFTLQDRMVDSNCDSVTMLACSKCGSLLHADLSRNVVSDSDGSLTLLGKGSAWHSEPNSGPFDRTYWSCRLCDRSEEGTSNPELTGANKSHLKRVKVPASFRYLTYELACLNVQTQLAVGELV